MAANPRSMDMAVCVRGSVFPQWAFRAKNLIFLPRYRSSKIKRCRIVLRPFRPKKSQYGASLYPNTQGYFHHGPPVRPKIKDEDMQGRKGMIRKSGDDE